MRGSLGLLTVLLVTYRACLTLNVKRQCLVEWVYDEGVSDNPFVQSSILLIFQQVLVGSSDAFPAWP